MGEVRTKFTSDSRDVEKSLDRMHRDMIKLREANKKLNRESKRGTSDTKRGLEQAIGKYVAVGAAIGAVKTVLSAVIKAHEDWLETLRKIDETQKKISQRRIAETIAAGDVPAAVSVALSTIRGAKAEDVTRTYAAIRGAAPLAQAGAAVGLTAQLVPLAQVGLGEQLPQIAAIAGEIMKTAPEMSKQDIADAALGVWQAGGKAAGQIGTAGFQKGIGALTAAGISTERAYGLGLAAAEGNIPRDQFVRAISALSDEARLEKVAPDLLGMTIGDRLEAVLADQDLSMRAIGATTTTNLGLINRESADKFAQVFETAREKDHIADTIEAATGITEGRQLQDRYLSEVERERAESNKATRAFEETQQLYRDETAVVANSGGFIDLWLNRTRMNIARTAEGLEGELGFAGPLAEQMRANVGQMGVEAGEDLSGKFQRRTPNVPTTGEDPAAERTATATEELAAQAAARADPERDGE